MQYHSQSLSSNDYCHQLCVLYERMFLELKAKVAVNDVYITELEEENEKVEKQYHKEKQLTKG